MLKIPPSLLVLLFFSFSICYGTKCGHSSCSYTKGTAGQQTAYLMWDKLNTTNKFTVLPNSYIDLNFEVKSQQGPKSGPVYIYLLDNKQLQDFYQDHAKAAQFQQELKKGYTWFETNAGSRLSERLYFGQDYSFTIAYYYGPIGSSSSRAESRDDPTPPSNATAVIEFTYSPPESCMIEMGAFIGIIVLVAVVAIVGCVLVDVIFNRVKKKSSGMILDDDFINMDDALGDEDSPTQFTPEEKKFHYLKGLQEQKERRNWCFRPSGPEMVRRPICAMLGVNQPRYDFLHYFLFNHEWLSLIKPDPEGPLNRTISIVLVLTYFFLRLFMLLIWNQTFDITDDKIYKDEGETIAINVLKYVPPTIITWVVETIFALAYSSLVVWRLNHPNLCRIGRDSDGGGLSDDDDYAGDFGEVSLEDPGQSNKAVAVAKSALNFLLRHVLLLVMFVFALAVIVASLVMLGENITCEVFGKLVAGVVVVEFYKSVFPGTLLLWLSYWFKNTFGAPPPMENPWDEDDEDVYLAD